MQQDGNRELRAIILAALPYPPLPMKVHRIEENRLQEEKVISSHDVISHLMEAHSQRNDAKAAALRLRRQRDVLRHFLADLVREGLQDPPALYDTYCRYTRMHIGTYYPEDAQPSVFFLPLGYVCKGDTVHRQACDYMAGQARLLELQSGLAHQDWIPMEFAYLLMVARDRLVCEGKDERQLAEEAAEVAMDV